MSLTVAHAADELEDLWPAVCEVAALLIDGQDITHDTVLAAIDRCRDSGTTNVGSH